MKPIFKIFNLDEFDIKDFHILSDEEKKKFEKILAENSREYWAKSRIILRQQLAILKNCKPEKINFSYMEFGKPYLEDSNIHFNISHSKNYLLFAYSKGTKVGVDIQYIDLKKNTTSLESRLLTKNELENFSSLNDFKRKKEFYKYWCLKEALSKVNGKGLQEIYSKMEIVFDGSLVKYQDIECELVNGPEGFYSSIAWKRRPSDRQ